MIYFLCIHTILATLFYFLLFTMQKKICRLVQLTEIISKSSKLFKARCLVLWICICLLEKFPIFVFLFVFSFQGSGNNICDRKYCFARSVKFNHLQRQTYEAQQNLKQEKLYLCNRELHRNIFREAKMRVRNGDQTPDW